MKGYMAKSSRIDLSRQSATEELISYPCEILILTSMAGG
jgi:hypothetical protein